MLSRVVILLLCALTCRTTGHSDDSYPLSDAFIARINREQTLWKAGRNYHVKSSLKLLLSMLPEHDVLLPTREDKEEKTETDLPRSFDSRTKWKQCDNIGAVVDQGNCAAGWAVAPTSVLSDRICVAGGGGQVVVSAQHVLSCCKKCGAGCFGGYANKSLEYLRNHGAPTGSATGWKGCQPYAVKKCNSVGPMPYCGAVRDPTPQCGIYYCSNTGYNEKLGSDLRKAAQVYSVPNDLTEIRLEIYNYGSVLAVLDVYEDLFSYKYGVYRHVLGNRVGRQEVKLIGWGSEKNKPYWLAVNSWGTKWGSGGLLKIFAGVNECNVEARVLGLQPDV